MRSHGCLWSTPNWVENIFHSDAFVFGSAIKVICTMSDYLLLNVDWYDGCLYIYPLALNVAQFIFRFWFFSSLFFVPVLIWEVLRLLCIIFFDCLPLVPALARWCKVLKHFIILFCIEQSDWYCFLFVSWTPLCNAFLYRSYGLFLRIDRHHWSTHFLSNLF